MQTSDAEKYFVDENEKVYATYEDDIAGDGIVKDLYFQLIVTDKNIYANSIYDNEEQENIIDLQTVEYVNYIHTKKKANKNSFVLFSLLMLLSGIILICVSIASESMLFLVGIILASVGLILTIIALVLNIPKHICKLIIGTAGEPIELIANNISPDIIKRLQKDIFRAKNESQLIQ